MTDAKPPEPSIEDILASIRKIISDDEPETDAAHEHDHGTDDEILELTDVVFDAPPDHGEEPPAEIDLPHDHAEEPAATVVRPVQAVPAAPRDRDVDTLASEETVAAASGAFAKLSHTTSPHIEAPMPASGGRSVEDIVRELLKPLLREWIDQNLAAIVERSVERELRKISRKAEDS